MLNNQTYSQRASQGANLLLSDYLKLRSEESLCLILDGQFKAIYAESIAYIEEAAQHMGVNLSIVYDSPDYLFKRLEADVYLFAGRNKSHKKKEGMAIAQQGGRVFRSFDFGIDLLELALQTPRDILVNLNDRLISRGQCSRQASIRSFDGTDLQISFGEQFFWTDSYGAGSNAFPGILPPGEINTFPLSVDGVIVASGALNSSISLPCSPIVDSCALTLEFEDSYCYRWQADSVLLQQTLDLLFSIENACRVGEFGIGTNLGVTQFVPYVSHINERRPGPHIGLGTPTQPAGTTDWSSLVHLDIILPDASVWFDDQLVYDGHRFIEPLASDTFAPVISNRLLVDAV
ncbi:hypothetical protein S7335_552 [Synechococcus sp. PCC 7335]|uniref:hypothetical protein n=1 Tax=Synechococcus sp. (strain ATCC 29403 / PCC 7335) TaxID=91464 RepID=UPI00017EC0B5|nr:hypothetical protein [Synechococcus sp. PCC 7335]EDX83372.1 hypothetical protein S7335_552 [Synechococcus sp. PCC 7335]